MLTSQARQFGELLVDRHVLSRDALEAAIDEAERTDVPLPSVLARSGQVGTKDLTAALAASMGLRFVDFQVAPLHPEATTIVPAAVAWANEALAVDFEDGKLVVAFAEPGDDEAVSAVGRAAGYEIVPAAADRDELARVLAAVHGPPPDEVATAAADEPDLHVNDLLDHVLDSGGSDLHLTAGSPPAVRVNGALRPLPDLPALTGSQLRQMVYSVITQRQREKFENELELDTSYSLPGKSRFRMNVFLQRDSVGCVMRVIPFEIVPFERLGVPESVRAFAELPRGLVLVTGPTGSGKSTTLASLIDIVNSTKPYHIMTVEDPIEFLHHHKQSVVNQREVGEDTRSFANALKHVLRQDPDVILVGEMRDLETISTALTAAETGHLVFATLHTQDAPQSIDRIIDVFPAHQQQQVRVQLASSLQGIVTQQLVATSDGTGRAAACEVLVATPAIRNLVREGKIHQIPSMIQAGGKHGMVTMDASLAALVRAGRLSLDVAFEHSSNPEELRRLAQR